MNKQENLAELNERLNRYVEALNAEESTARFEIRNDEEARLWQLTRDLKVDTHPEQATPRPQFAADLEQRLLARQATMMASRTYRPWWQRGQIIFSPPRWAAIAAVGLVVVGLVLFGRILVGDLNPPRLQLPSLVSVAWAYSGLEGLPSFPALLGNASFELGTSLPVAPERLTVYQQVSNPLTVTEAETLASRFGLQGKAHRVGESFIVEDKDGRLVISRIQRGYYHYQSFSPSLLPSASLEDAAAVARYAETFLQQRELLAFDYRSQTPEPLPSDEGTARYRVVFVQTAGEHPVENAGVTVIVDDVDGVVKVTSRVLSLESVGRYPIIAAEKACATLQGEDSRQDVLVDVHQRGTGTVSVVVRETIQDSQSFPPHHAGDHVQLEGLLSVVVFENADGSVHHVQAFLATDLPSDQLAYRLIGPEVADMVTYDRLHVQVWGTVVIDAGGEPALVVEDYQRSRPEERFVTLLGRLILGQAEGQEQILLLTDDGSHYVLLPWGQDQDEITRNRSEGRLGQPALVGGTLTAQRSAEGYPILTVAGVVQGSEIDVLKSADQYPWLWPTVVQSAIPSLSGQAVITRVTLRYFALPVPADLANGVLLTDSRYLWPVYRFEGHTADGTSFSVWVQATHPD